MDLTAAPDVAQTSTVYLEYDDSLAYGSREHYFHYLWGYLLPALHWWIEQGDAAPARLCFMTCGPSMDPLTVEASTLMGLPFEIVTEPPEGARRVTLTRWDGILYRHSAFLGPVAGIRTRITRVREILALGLQDREALPFPSQLRRLKQEADTVRRVLSKAALTEGSADPELAGKILVLRRSPMPEYYGEDGKAKVKGYGVGRRSLVGIDEAVERLNADGLNVTTFEPGSTNLAGQIRAFSHATGIVGIRGAEFGNLIWMGAGYRALMVSPRSMRWTDSPADLFLASVMGIDLTEKIVEDAAQVPLDPADVLRVFKA